MPPLKLRGGLVLPDDVALAPMTNLQSEPDGRLGDDELRWILARARAGFRVVFSCAAFVSLPGKAWPGQLGVAGPEHREGLERYANGVREAGGVSILQLYHGGYQALPGPDRVGPSARDGVRAMSEAEIQAIPSVFAEAATLAFQAGFDGVEVHGANGYLFTQFLAPLDNDRTDGWGGDLAGRARLIRDTVAAVRAVTPAGRAVGVRLSPVDTWARRGLTLEEGWRVAAWMAEDGVDWVHLSLGSASGPAPHEPGSLPVAAAIREVIPADVALFAAGGVQTWADAEAARRVGVDVVVVGKAGIRHPDWPICARQPGFSPAPTPWPLADLDAVSVSRTFQAYLQRFPGLVEGGAPPRPAAG